MLGDPSRDCASCGGSSTRHGAACLPQASCRREALLPSCHARGGLLPAAACVCCAAAADQPLPSCARPCPHPPAPAERQWFKSVQGLGPCIRETDRNASFCAWTLLPDQPNVMVRVLGCQAAWAHAHSAAALHPPSPHARHRPLMLPSRPSQPRRWWKTRCRTRGLPKTRSCAAPRSSASTPARPSSPPPTDTATAR